MLWSIQGACSIPQVLRCCSKQGLQGKQKVQSSAACATVRCSAPRNSPGGTGLLVGSLKLERVPLPAPDVLKLTSTEKSLYGGAIVQSNVSRPFQTGPAPVRRIARFLLAWSLGVTAGCLKLNTDFQADSGQHNLGQLDLGQQPESSSQLTPAPTDEAQLTPTGETDATQTKQDQSSQDTTGVRTSLSDSTVSTADTSNSTSAFSTSEQTSSEQDLVTRWNIEVNAAHVTETILPEYPLSLTFDHQAMVSQGAQDDGSDLAIVSIRNNTTNSLPRVLDEQSSWNRPDTTIWFTIDASLQAGSTAEDVYFLVVQDPNITANTEADSVFTDFEDFGNTLPSSSAWSQVRSGAGHRELTASPDAVVLTAQRDPNYPITYITLRQQAKSYWASMRIDVMSRMTNTGLTGSCGRLFPVSLTSNGDNSLRAGLRSNLAEYAALSFDDDLGINQVESITNPTPTTGVWQLHSLAWIGTEISYWHENSRILTTQSQGSITQSNQTNLQLEFNAGSASAGCTQSGALGLEIDWYRVRRYTFPEPTARIKP